MRLVCTWTPLRNTKAGILFNEHTAEDGPIVFAHACRLGAESIASKIDPVDVIKVRNPASIAVQRERSEFWNRRACVAIQQGGLFRGEVGPKHRQTALDEPTWPAIINSIALSLAEAKGGNQTTFVPRLTRAGLERVMRVIDLIGTRSNVTDREVVAALIGEGIGEVDAELLIRFVPCALSFPLLKRMGLDKFPSTYQGRNCAGQWMELPLAQILGSFFGLPANPANTPGGTNYAIGGAFNGATLDATLGPGHQNLFTTVKFPPDSFISPGQPIFGANPNLPGTAAQISNYLASVNGHANPSALYLISSGGNNAFYASTTFGANAAAANVFLLSEAQALANGVAQLQQAGARYIIVADGYQPPSADANAVAYGHTIFTATWADLAAAGVKFIPADTASAIAAVEQNPLSFGITAPISSNACMLPFAIPGLTTGYGVICAPITKQPNPEMPSGFLMSADATRTRLFIDSTHLTEAGQIIIADYYYNLLVAPSEVSVLAETAIQTTLQTINGIQQQIDLSGRLRPAGFSVWMNGGLSSLKFDNSAPGFPSDLAWPVSGTLGFDYKWLSGWLVGAAVTAGYANPTFSLRGGFTQNVGSLSAYTAYYNHDFWGNLIGTIGFLDDQTSRNVPIGITVQPNVGSTTGYDLSLAGEVGYDLHTGPITHGPVGGFILQQAVINGFTESGSFTSLSFGQQIRNSQISLLGYQARYDWGDVAPVRASVMGSRVRSA